MTPAALTLRDRVHGCLLAGAAGDALGAPVEFATREAIRHRFGPDGITELAPAYGRIGAITDDTQMTLFTAEGLLRSHVRGAVRGHAHPTSIVAHAYLRWLHTQGIAAVVPWMADAPGWLIALDGLHDRRAPGRTCVTALETMPHVGAPAINGSKGCGGVMRAAPVGLYAARLKLGVGATFGLGVDTAAITHGHPTGQLTAGALAVIVRELCLGATLDAALDAAVVCLSQQPSREETLASLIAARALARERQRTPAQAIGVLGQGWIAEEALAIAVYCALVGPSLRDGVVLAVNHSGDSDSTGAIAGNILGARDGVTAIPASWLEPLELRDDIAALADDLIAFADWRLDGAAGAAILTRYPPS